MYKIQYIFKDRSGFQTLWLVTPYKKTQWLVGAGLLIEYFYIVVWYSFFSNGSECFHQFHSFHLLIIWGTELWSKVCLSQAQAGGKAPDFAINTFWQYIKLLRKCNIRSSGRRIHTRSEPECHITFNIQNTRDKKIMMGNVTHT